MTKEEVIKAINSTLGLDLDFKSIPLNATLESLGIDSLDFYNLLVEIENETGKSVSDEDVESMLTIGEISDYFS